MIYSSIRENTSSIAEQEGINPEVFSKKRIFKNEEHEEIIKEIRKEYLEFLDFFLSGRTSKLENELGISEKDQEKEFENTITCFKGAFRSFLKNIKARYQKKKNFWKKINFSKRKKCPR